MFINLSSYDYYVFGRQFNMFYPPFKKNSRIYLLNEINTANH